MKNLIYIPIVISIFLYSCGNDSVKSPDELQIELKNEIVSIESQLFAEDNKALNYGKAKDVVEKYIEYANKFPSDKETAKYIFKAADVSMGLQEYEKADKLLYKIISEYGEFEKVAEAMYLRGFIYDVHLNKKGEAKAIYEKVIEKFPNHPFAQDAKSAIDMLTLSDEDLIKILQEKNKEVN
jgi:TolA-binding protein